MRRTKKKAPEKKVHTKESREARKARHEETHEAIARAAKKAGDQAEALSAEAKSAFYSLPRKVRDSLRARYKNDGWSYASWLLNGTDKHAKRARRVRNAAKEKAKWKGFGDFLKASKQKPIRIKNIAPHKDKRVAKAIRAAMMPSPPKNPYAALLVPMVIVPDDPAAKVVIADAGSIVKLADQATFYRNRTSPITRRADEILVHYGKAKSPSLGWITQKRLSSKEMKPSKGPTFLVMTRAEDALNAWEQFRLRCARARKNDQTLWIARWLATHGAKHPQQLREVTRFFGGKPIKNESTDVRIERLFALILHTELDMATAKKGKGKKHKKGKKQREEKETKKSKKGKKSRVSSDTMTAKQDSYVIRRLVKENPRRAGSAKAKLWDKLRKGMTVGDFVAKGGSRASVARYVENGWVKLLKPKRDDDE